MTLMIDLEPMLPLVTAIKASSVPRGAVVKAYHEIPNPSAEETAKFIDDYLKASLEWANACGSLAKVVTNAVDELREHA